MDSFKKVVLFLKVIVLLLAQRTFGNWPRTFGVSPVIKYRRKFNYKNN